MSRKRSRFDAEAEVPAVPPASSVQPDGVAAALAAARAAASRAAAAAAAAALTSQPALSAVPASSMAAVTPVFSHANAMATAAIEAAKRAALLRANAAAAVASSLEPPTAAQLSGAGGGASMASHRPSMLPAASSSLDAVLNIPVNRVHTLLVNEKSGSGGGQRVGGRVSKEDRQAAAAARQQLDAADLSAAVRANPYLAHRAAPTGTTSSASDGQTRASSTGEIASSLGAGVVDPRLHSGARRRDTVAARALHFVAEGAHSAAADAERIRAARAAAAATTGSRHRPAAHFDVVETAPHVATTDAADASSAATAGAPPVLRALLRSLPPRSAAAAPPPDIEWWDAAFLPPQRASAYAARYSVAGRRAAAATASAVARAEGAAVADEAPGGTATAKPFSYDECSLDVCRTAALVAHPPPLRNAAADAEAAAAPTSLPLILTARERKRLRRAARAERLKERQDAVRLGLLPPPEPKVRLGNLMRVLKDSAVADPSAIERRVRDAVAARTHNHEMRNAAAKLTPAEREAKRRRKMTEAAGTAPSIALFRVAGAAGAAPQARFKVEAGARETYLSGVSLAVVRGGVPDVHLVLVEGGPLAIRRYVRLMTVRIDWRKGAAAVRASAAAGAGGGDSSANFGNEDDDDEDSDSEDDEDEDGPDAMQRSGVTKKGAGCGPGSLCELVWRGTAPRRSFADFRFEVVRTAAAARKLMEGRGLAHTWDLVAASDRAATVESTSGEFVVSAFAAVAAADAVSKSGIASAAAAAGGGGNESTTPGDSALDGCAHDEDSDKNDSLSDESA